MGSCEVEKKGRRDAKRNNEKKKGDTGKIPVEIGKTEQFEN